MDQTKTAHNLIEQVFVDTSGQKPRYIVMSRNKRYIQISASAYGILEKVEAGHSFVTIAQTMSSERDTTITEGEVQLAYRYVLDKIQSIDESAQGETQSFWIRIPLLPARLVTAISSRLTFLFHPVAVLVVLSSLLLLSYLVLQRGLLNMHVSQTAENLILFYFLFLLSVMAHEFGHASACVRGGVKPSEIGFTVYLVFPAFYSNVSASWQLSRWKKVRVDVGGIYFQLCIGVIYLVLDLLFKLPIFQLAFLAIISSCLLSLNPFTKFDGYWIISDALGITNLSRRPSELVTYWYNGIRKRPRKALPYTLRTAWIIAIYGLLRSGIIVSFVVATSPFLWRAMISYPALITSSLSHWRSGSLTNLLTDIEALGGNSLLLLLWGMSLLFLSQPLVLRVWTNLQESFASQLQAMREYTRLHRRMLVSSILLLGVATLILAGLTTGRQLQDQQTAFTAYPPVDAIPCQSNEQFADHYHAHLSIFINDQAVSIPKVGIGSNCYYWLHVHDGSGILHIEAPTHRIMTLGNFFHLWKARFSSLGSGIPAQLEQKGTWQIYLNGNPYHGDFNDIVLQDHLLITLGYNSPHMVPGRIYNWSV